MGSMDVHAMADEHPPSPDRLEAMIDSAHREGALSTTVVFVLVLSQVLAAIALGGLYAWFMTQGQLPPLWPLQLWMALVLSSATVVPLAMTAYAFARMSRVLPVNPRLYHMGIMLLVAGIGCATATLVLGKWVGMVVAMVAVLLCLVGMAGSIALIIADEQRFLACSGESRLHEGLRQLDRGILNYRRYGDMADALRDAGRHDEAVALVSRWMAAAPLESRRIEKLAELVAHQDPVLAAAFRERSRSLRQRNVFGLTDPQLWSSVST